VAMQEPAANEVANRTLHRIAALEVTGMRVERPGDLGDRWRTSVLAARLLAVLVLVELLVALF
jgi:hypothetical protein